MRIRQTDTIVQSNGGDFYVAIDHSTRTWGAPMSGTAISVILDDARKIISRGERKAIAMRVPNTIAVADAGARLIAHTRMK
jgi:hypothetical protein